MSDIADRERVKSMPPDLRYPKDAFPAIVRAVISEEHKGSNIAEETLGAAALGAMSIIFQGSTDVRVHASDSPFPCSLFLLTIAEPYSGKSYAMKIFNQAIVNYEILVSAEIDKENLTFEGRLAAWKVTEKKFSKEFARAEHGTQKFEECERLLIEHHRKKPEKLTHKGLIFKKATAAGMREMLRENDGAIGLAEPDAGSLLNGHTFSDMPLFSGLWSGEDVRDGLASGGPPLIEPRATLSLMAQDSEVRKFMKKRGEDALGNGLLSRFLIMRSPLVDATQNEFPRDKISLLHARFLDILINAKAKHRGRVVLNFSNSAQQYWREYRENLKNQIDRDGWSTGKIYFVKRLPEQVARIAALFHRIEQGDSVIISLDSVHGARRLCDWYLSKFDDVFVAKDLRDAQRIREWIVRHYRKKFYESNDRFLSTVYSTRTLLQFGPVRDVDDLSNAMKILIVHGDVIEDRFGPKGGGNFDFGPLLRGSGLSTTGRVIRSPVRVTSIGDEEDTSTKSDDFLG